MSKSTKVIAGLGIVAGLAVAMAPFAAHADTTLGIDTLNVTVGGSCTIANALESSYSGFTNTYTESLTAKDAKVLGASGTPTDAVTIICNYPSGYTVTGTGSNLDKGALAGTPAVWTADAAPNADYIEPGANPVAGTGTWGVQLSGTTNLSIPSAFTGSTNYGALPIAGTTVASKSGPSEEGGDTLTIAGYKVSTRDNQMAGEYQGTATYRLSHAN